MTPLILLQLVLKYGPQVIAYAVKFGPDALNIIHQIHALAQSGKSSVSPDDLAQLQALSGKTADDYLRAAGVPKP